MTERLFINLHYVCIKMPMSFWILFQSEIIHAGRSMIIITKFKVVPFITLFCVYNVIAKSYYNHTPTSQKSAPIYRCVEPVWRRYFIYLLNSNEMQYEREKFFKLRGQEKRKRREQTRQAAMPCLTPWRRGNSIYYVTGKRRKKLTIVKSLWWCHHVNIVYTDIRHWTACFGRT